jgi:hypothetical protein
MTFTAIVTAHAEDPSRILGNLLYQTRKVDEIICICSEVSGLAKLREHFPSVVFVETENRNDWGHEKRAMGIDLATSDALGFFNADDSYDIRYVELMMSTLEEEAVEAVYCSWNKIPGCAFALASSTSGNFIVLRGTALRAGYEDRHYEADGTFINRVRAIAHVARVDELLYYHNHQ